MMIGTFTRNTEPYQKWPSRKPLATGPSAPAAPVMLAQIAIAFGRSCGGKMLMMIDSVDGMIERGGTAHHRAASDELAHRCRRRREERADEEQCEPDLQRALATEAIAERAGREEQAREHERVDRHDPLQLRLGRVQVAGQRRDGDVQARVAHEHDEQAQAQHGQGPPASCVELRVRAT